MKKFIVPILAFLYLGVSSGIAMEIHYCMGQKAGAELFGGDNKKCSKCGMKEKKGGCCKDEHKFYKLQDLHKNVSNTLSFEAPVVFIATAVVPYIQQMVAAPAITHCNNHSPPPLAAGMQACILHGVFRL